VCAWFGGCPETDDDIALGINSTGIPMKPGIKLLEIREQNEDCTLGIAREGFEIETPAPGA
jgi:hypothetical protein